MCDKNNDDNDSHIFGEHWINKTNIYVCVWARACFNGPTKHPKLAWWHTLVHTHEWLQRIYRDCTAHLCLCVIFYCFKWFIYLLWLLNFNAVATVAFVCVRALLNITCTCVCIFSVGVCVMILLQISQPFLTRCVQQATLRSFIYLLHVSFASPMLLMLCAIYKLHVFRTWHVYASFAVFFFFNLNPIR